MWVLRTSNKGWPVPVAPSMMAGASEHLLKLMATIRALGQLKLRDPC